MRVRQILSGALGGAKLGLALGASLAVLVLAAGFLSGSTFVPKWEMSVFSVSLVYVLGFTLSGSVAGALGPFASSRWRAYAVGTLSALPFALVATAGYLGPDQEPRDYVIPAFIWAVVVGGVVGLILHSLRSDG